MEPIGRTRRLAGVKLGRLRALGSLALLAGIVVMACTPAPPSAVPASQSGAPASPSAAPASAVVETPAAVVEFVLGCLSIEATECEDIARLIADALEPERQPPFAIEIHLFGCAADPCDRSLSARDGTATVEYVNGGEPIVLSLAGPPETPRIERADFSWLGPYEPESARVVGQGPFPFDLGHCGLLWKVDFDGSFWLPVGQVDGDSAAVIGDEHGAMVLLAPNRAQFRGESGFIANLERFPGPKHIWGCR